jgi:acetaldehyde dehydrogenase (acetylating)
MPVVLAAVENTEANINQKECGGGKTKPLSLVVSSSTHVSYKTTDAQWLRSRE